jgi:hypothetical protein
MKDSKAPSRSSPTTRNLTSLFGRLVSKVYTKTFLIPCTFCRTFLYFLVRQWAVLMLFHQSGSGSNLCILLQLCLNISSCTPIPPNEVSPHENDASFQTFQQRLKVRTYHGIIQSRLPRISRLATGTGSQEYRQTFFINVEAILQSYTNLYFV